MPPGDELVPYLVWRDLRWRLLLDDDEFVPKYLGLPGRKPLLEWDAASGDLRGVCVVEGPLDCWRCTNGAYRAFRFAARACIAAEFQIVIGLGSVPAEICWRRVAAAAQSREFARERLCDAANAGTRVLVIAIGWRA